MKLRSSLEVSTSCATNWRFRSSDMPLAVLSKLAKSLGFSSYSVFTHKVHAYYMCRRRERLLSPSIVFLSSRMDCYEATDPVDFADRGCRRCWLFRLAAILRS